MKKMNTIPKLRFPEFEGEWTNILLGKLLEFKNGINANKEQYGSGVKFINVLDILNNDFITYDKILGSVDIDAATLENNSVEFGDILFQRSSETRAEVGTANVYLDKERKATFGGFVIRGKKIGNYHPIFINKLLKTDLVRKSITCRSGGSTRYNISQSVLASTEIVLPTLDEQQKIASFLTSIDERIDFLRQKKEKLEKYKKGMMQKLFSQEVRFKDKNGKDFPEWEEKKLGEFCEFVGGGTPRTSIKRYWEGTIPWISSSDISDESIHKIEKTRFITQEAIENSATKLIPKGSILMVSRVGIGKFAIADEDLCTSQDFTNLITTENEYFIGYYFKARSNRFVRLSQGTSIKGFTTKDIKSVKFLIPRPKEQKKIADFLSAIDEKIEKTDQEMSVSKEYKKGLLQKMFV